MVLPRPTDLEMGVSCGLVRGWMFSFLLIFNRMVVVGGRHDKNNGARPFVLVVLCIK